MGHSRLLEWMAYASRWGSTLPRQSVCNGRRSLMASSNGFSTCTHGKRERESREREKTWYFPEVLFRSVQTKWCAVYSQKVALWDQILALSSPLPLLPCSLVCFLREGGREGVKSEGGEGGCTTHTCLYQPSTVQHKYNSNLWKASLH